MILMQLTIDNFEVFPSCLKSLVPLCIAHIAHCAAPLKGIYRPGGDSISGNVANLGHHNKP